MAQPDRASDFESEGCKFESCRAHHKEKYMKLFKPFGPSIGKVELKKTIIGNVNDYCDKVMASKLKSKKLDHSSKLIGNVEQQFIITRSNFKKILEKEVIFSIKKYYLGVLGVKVKKIKIDSAWIVCQYAGDFNPPHIHRGNISGVGYLKIPQTIISGREKKLAGHISFMDGRVSMPRNSPPLVQHRQTFKPKVGNLFIFPSFLMHDVHPFRGDGERRSFSFNAFVDS